MTYIKSFVVTLVIYNLFNLLNYIILQNIHFPFARNVKYINEYNVIVL